MKTRLSTATATGLVVATAICLTLSPLSAAERSHAKSKHRYAQKKPATEEITTKKRQVRDGGAEAKLIEVYKLIGQNKNREALVKAELLVKNYPHFQLAQLVYGDLLASRTRPVQTVGDVPATVAKSAGALLADLRQESQQRLKALRERPLPDTIPSQFLTLSPLTKHAIAVDSSRSRLYLFENTANGLKLVADYYLSVGKSGTEKSVQGDQRTPLGVYFITSQVNRKSLTAFYGSGALPINYPNQLDIRRGKTGSGIWLHGTPNQQFSRPPLASDGCLVLANPDLERIINTVEVRRTPVVIAQSLKWVPPKVLENDIKSFESVLSSWHRAKASGNLDQLVAWYAPDYTVGGKKQSAWTPELQTEFKRLGGRNTEIKDLSYLRWSDSTDTMIVTFAELVKGAQRGQTKRQYWSRQGSQWKIFFEGVV